MLLCFAINGISVCDRVGNRSCVVEQCRFLRAHTVLQLIFLDLGTNDQSRIPADIHAYSFSDEIVPISANNGLSPQGHSRACIESTASQVDTWTPL